jgi:signal transduction histidine kinase
LGYNGSILRADTVHHPHLRFGLIPLAVAGLSAVLVVTTRVEQERQVDALRQVYESHARSAGHLVREAAQEATWSTGLVYSMSAEAAALLLELLGPPGADEDCVALQARVPDLAIWARRDADGVRGCLDRVPVAGRVAFVDGVLAVPEGDFVDDGRTRELGVFCAWSRGDGVATVVCLDRDDLDGMRREVGLGPLLAGLKAQDLEYVVVQDPGGILAASPMPGQISTWGQDPVLAQVRDGAPDGLQGRMLQRGGQSVYEVIGPLELADGTRAVVRTALDAGELVRFGRRIALRQTVMFGVLAGAVLLSLALAWVLGRGARRRTEFLAAMRHREEEGRHWRSLGLMAATVAHEVRNPLNTIGMALQRLSREVRVDPADEEGFRELLMLSADASDRVERVVAEFLELGKPLDLDLRPYPAAGLVHEALASQRMRAESEGKGLDVRCDCPGDVVVDRQRFGQIAANLVANALDAVGPAGRVTVVAGCDGDAFRLVVSDDGPGMDAATLERVQAPFVTTKAHGTGLGLPLARRLAEAHGGTLVLESIPGSGTRATVTLPVSGTQGGPQGSAEGMQR